MLEKKMKSMKSQFFIDLATEEQQLLAGGQATVVTPTFNQMPQVLGRGFPNVPSLNPFGGMGQGQGEEVVNSQGNKSGVVLY
jgi:hypothetical protein